MAFPPPNYEGSIFALTPTLCRLFDIAAPAECQASPLESVLANAGARLEGGKLERCLVYCPDALGDHLWLKFPEQRARLDGVCSQRVSLESMTPPKTPVCFASMFTGAPPEVHGIRQYKRYVLMCDTLFDAFIRTGRRVAIVTVENSSIDLIFREREIDYYPEEYDAQVTERALELLSRDEHDLIVVYHQEYDDLLHRTQPFSEPSLAAMRHHVEAGEVLVKAAKRHWQARNSAVVIAPDHGAHVDAETGHGNHGLDVPDDMAVSHWYGVFAGAGRPRPGAP